jgi:hypothetical protein
MKESDIMSYGHGWFDPFGFEFWGSNNELQNGSQFDNTPSATPPSDMPPGVFNATGDPNNPVYEIVDGGNIYPVDGSWAAGVWTETDGNGNVLETYQVDPMTLKWTETDPNGNVSIWDNQSMTWIPKAAPAPVPTVVGGLGPPLDVGGLGPNPFSIPFHTGGGTDIPGVSHLDVPLVPTGGTDPSSIPFHPGGTFPISGVPHTGLTVPF